MTSVLIIGAGLAGLTAARELTRHYRNVTLLDKGRGVGGRLATRRIEQSRADHGAQYFSAKTPPFQKQVNEWMQAGLVNEWPLQEGSTEFQHPRYVGANGMNAIAKHLARDLDIRTGERAVRLVAQDSGWRVETEVGTTYQADALLITIPAPQVLALLSESGIDLNSTGLSVLKSIEYQPCIAVMALLNQPSHLPAPGYLKYEEGPVAWVADNQQKGISPNQPSVTIHASHPYSEAHLEEDMNAVGRELVNHLADWIPAGSVDSVQVHRWRYSNAERRHPEAYLAAATSQPLLFGGDGFGIGNVEGAVLSGLAMAESLVSRLLPT
ncbi:FAD-dependent oxidoreductase [Nibrella saemangeumensis]|uniref:FAD-dependent oxidoreductase n=1 Tax=Nibrella saemangeumensis TaxID=1084526 RepID=A0ABP8MXN9_9BACT